MLKGDDIYIARVLVLTISWLFGKRKRAAPSFFALAGNCIHTKPRSLEQLKTSFHYMDAIQVEVVAIFKIYPSTLLLSERLKKYSC